MIKVSYVIQASLCNSDRIVLGVVTIPFPLNQNEYDHSIGLLNEQQIGDAVKQDCYVDAITSKWSAVKILEGQYVNVDELDYLAKRLDSFNEYEAKQFQAACSALGCRNIKDLINLTFCCRQVTVITDFSDLEQIGRAHYMNLNSGCASIEELENLDGEETARLLIDSGAGVITPYGVVFENGMKLEQVYDGSHFPEYHYETSKAVVTLTPAACPEAHEYLYLPCPSGMISRAFQRLGSPSMKECHAKLETGDICDAVRGVFEDKFILSEHIETLNQLAKCYMGFDADMLEKFHTVLDHARPGAPEEVLLLAQNIEEFTVLPHISSAEEYGQYLVRQSGHYELDPNLDGFINYRELGEHRIQEEKGSFSDRGYVAYGGTDPLIEKILPSRVQTQEMKMGGQQYGAY